MANAGEFSLRAYMNGKMDLLQAESICDLISAGTEAAARYEQYKGATTVDWAKAAGASVA